MFYWLLSLAGIAILLLLLKKYAFTQKQYLRVLMYHKVSSNGDRNSLSIDSVMLERQFHHLKKEGYTPILLSQLADFVLDNKTLPEKPILLTFDDGYIDNFTVLYPLLKQYGVLVNIFLIAAVINKNGNAVNLPANIYLTLNDIMAMDSSIVEFGLHSYDHKNYGELSIAQLNQDIKKSKALLTSLGVPFQPCLAFPYGAYPKGDKQKQLEFFETLTKNNISIAFRIGNRLNPLPLKNPLLIQRLDIKGNMPFKKFTRLVKQGKSILN